MANSIAVNVIQDDQQRQFQGLFTKTWAVKATITWDAAVAINDTGAYTFTVPDVALGDMVIGFSTTMDWADSAPDYAVLNVAVTAANTCTLYVHADVAEFANDALNGAVLRTLIGRPNW